MIIRYFLIGGFMKRLISLFVFTLLLASCGEIDDRFQVFGMDVRWFQTVFYAPDGAQGNLYGSSLAVSADGNAFVVGAYRDSVKGSNSGAVYYYRWNGADWDWLKFLAYDGAAEDKFGISVAISADGNTFIAGARDDCDMGTNSGSVYYFHWNGTVWTTNKFTISDGDEHDKFGHSVAISGDGSKFIAGAVNQEDSVTHNWGAAYLFENTGSEWLTNKFGPFGNNNACEFGYSVAITSDGNTIAVGASYENVGTNYSVGAVYRFHWNGALWESTNLTPTKPTDHCNFGTSVDISDDGNTIATGAPYYFVSEDHDGQFAGAGYRFRWNGSGWEETELIESVYGNNWQAGNSVGISGDGSRVFVGVPCFWGPLIYGAIYCYSWNNGVRDCDILCADYMKTDFVGWTMAVSADGRTVIASGDVYDANWQFQNTGVFYYKE